MNACQHDWNGRHPNPLIWRCEKCDALRTGSPLGQAMTDHMRRIRESVLGLEENARLEREAANIVREHQKVMRHRAFRKRIEA